MKREMKRSSTLIKKQVKIPLRGLLSHTPTGEAEGRKAKEKLVTVNGCRDEGGRQQSERQ